MLRKSLKFDVKLQLHNAIYRLPFYSSSLIPILSLSNSHNNVASIQKNRRDKSHRVIGSLIDMHSCVSSLLRLLFTLRFLCVGSVQWAKFKGIITITGVAGLL